MTGSVLSLLAVLVIGCIGCSSAGKNTQTDLRAQVPADVVLTDGRGEARPDGSGKEDGRQILSDAPAEAADESAGDQVPHGLALLETLDPEAPFDDLEQFGKWFAGAAVVGIGEMAHRQAEFLSLRYRLVRYLVEEHGYRLVALETDWTNAEKVDEYVHSDCSGDPAQVVLENLRSLWHCQAIADMVQWMCVRNAANPDDQVSLFGVNIFQPWHDGVALMAFAQEHMPEEAETLEADLSICEGVLLSSEEEYFEQAGSTSAEERATCLDALSVIEAHINANEASLLSAMSNEELAIVRLHVVSLRGWEDFALSMGGMISPNLGENAREAAMAEIFLTLRELRHHDGKTVLVAHDLHLAMAAAQWTTVFPQDAVQIQWGSGTTRMGTHLKATLGDQYVPVGLRAWTYRGDLAVETSIEGAPSEPPLLERLMHETGYPMLMLDARNKTIPDPLIAPGEPCLFATPAQHPFTGEWLVALYESVFATQLSGYIFLDTTNNYLPL